jgi:hypothetical protein
VFGFLSQKSNVWEVTKENNKVLDVFQPYGFSSLTPNLRGDGYLVWWKTHELRVHKPYIE